MIVVQRCEEEVQNSRSRKRDVGALHISTGAN